MTNSVVKKIDDLTETDLRANPVWEFTNSHEGIEGMDETAVTPVVTVPVASLEGRLVGTKLQLANGFEISAILGNIHPHDPIANIHFLTATIMRGAERFPLARYHDFHIGTHGPAQLAQFLGLNINDVFPISYDITKVYSGKNCHLSGKIETDVAEKLTNKQRMDLIFANLRRQLRR